jgi:hypothetical protein
VGYTLAALMGLINVPSVLGAPDPGQAGPPLFILVIDTVLGLVALVGAVVAFRRGATWARIASVALVLIVLTALPGLFVSGIPAAVRVLIGASVILTFVVIWLMLAPAAPRGASR